MAEYIERKALYEKAYWHGEHSDVSNPFPDGVDAIDIKDVDAIPAADVAPVRHARWEDKPNPQWKAYDIRYCTACGWSIHKSKLRNSDLNWAYCPSCGARMDGGMTDGAIHL